MLPKASFTEGVCSAVTNNADALGLEIANISMITVSKDADASELNKTIGTLRKSNLDVVFGCTYYNTRVRFVQQAKLLEFSPKAIVLSSCVDAGSFLNDLGDDGKYF